jgi:hypothetical protein
MFEGGVDYKTLVWSKHHNVCEKPLSEDFLASQI